MIVCGIVIHNISVIEQRCFNAHVDPIIAAARRGGIAVFNLYIIGFSEREANLIAGVPGGCSALADRHNCRISVKIRPTGIFITQVSAVVRFLAPGGSRHSAASAVYIGIEILKRIFSSAVFRRRGKGYANRRRRHKRQR